jgi:hypothetical protein
MTAEPEPDPVPQSRKRMGWTPAEPVEARTTNAKRIHTNPFHEGPQRTAWPRKLRRRADDNEGREPGPGPCGPAPGVFSY